MDYFLKSLKIKCIGFAGYSSFLGEEGLEMAAAIFGYACLTMSAGGDDYFYRSPRTSTTLSSRSLARLILPIMQPLALSQVLPGHYVV